MKNRNRALIQDLKEASQFLREEDFDCLFSSFESADDFAHELDKIANLLESNSYNPLKRVSCFYLRKKAKLWFMPTCDWDDIVSGEKGLRLGNELFEKL